MDHKKNGPRDSRTLRCPVASRSLYAEGVGMVSLLFDPSVYPWLHPRAKCLQKRPVMELIVLIITIMEICIQLRAVH